MATTIGPDMMVDTPTASSFDFCPPGHFHSAARDAAVKLDPGFATLASPFMTPRPSAPPPNPPFVFPPRSSTSAPSSLSCTSGRPPRSMRETAEFPSTAAEVEGRPARSPALPTFSFNPGASWSANADASWRPPLSPTPLLSPNSTTSRPSGYGHRRGGSEFVGGNVRAGDSISVTVGSPTKSDSGIASPSVAPNRPGGRRGHAHRRSAAISSHELLSIMVPSSALSLRGSSAPTSPAGFGFEDNCSQDRPAQPEPSLTPKVGEKIPEKLAATETLSIALRNPPKPSNRNRVGFSDTLEYIPRPLSLVSSDTSSIATARPSHSMSGSISSIVSASTQDRDNLSPFGPGPVRPTMERRPSTAGAVLERSKAKAEEEAVDFCQSTRGDASHHSHSFASVDALASATPSPTKSSKRWLFGLEFSVAASPNRSRPHSADSFELQPKPSPWTTMCDHVPEAAPQDPAELASQTQRRRKRYKKQKKVTKWATSILPRKPRERSRRKGPKSLTPSWREDDDKTEDAVDDVVMDVAADSQELTPETMGTEMIDGNADGRTVPCPVSMPDEDCPYQMIDLDAALGPFNTPVPRTKEEMAQRAGGPVKKQLHSAAGMSRFTGPGMHYSHRRAESAPEMGFPLEAGRFGLHRFGSNSTMADVFEEDEEEDEADKSESDQSTPLAVNPAADTPEPTLSRDTRSQVPQDTQPSVRVPSAVASALGDAGGLGRGERNQPYGRLCSEDAASSPHEDMNVEESADAPGPTKLPACPTGKGRDLMPIDVSPVNLGGSLVPVSPYSMTQSSPFPSPISPMSYETRRISTAPSSIIAEDSFQSLLMGEPGPELRLSFDTYPSLISSTHSTVTRNTVCYQNLQVRQPSSDQPRLASFTSTALGRRRSSLASFSRLMNGSHGERSKLSIEVSVDADPEKKTSVSKRLIRMVQFWKARDSDDSPT